MHRVTRCFFYGERRLWEQYKPNASDMVRHLAWAIFAAGRIAKRGAGGYY